jgi:hypothetical protein
MLFNQPRIAVLLTLCGLCAIQDGAWAGAPFRDQPAGNGLSGIVLTPGRSFDRGIAPLFDPSRTSWSHSLSFGMASGAAGSVGQGLFLNSMDMRLGYTTDLKLHLGVLSTTFNSIHPEATGSEFVGGAEFQWNPSENLHLQVGLFRGMSPTSSASGPFGSPWSSSLTGASPVRY